MDTPTKRCACCHVEKPFSEFDIDNKRKDKHYPYCKDCKRIKGGHKKPEVLPDGFKRCSICKRILAATTENFYPHKTGKYSLNPGCKICRRAQHKERYAVPSYAERARQCTTKWRHSNPDKQRDSRRRWRFEHPDKKKAQTHRRRASKHSLPNAFTGQEWEYCLTYWNNCCAICGRPRGFFHTLAPDHWIALSDPRPDNPGTVATNILPLCHGEGGCNNSKKGSDPVQWLQWKFGKRKAKVILARIHEYFDNLTKDNHNPPLQLIEPSN